MAIMVKALESGFYGGKLRYPEDDAFEVAGESGLGRWMEVQQDKLLDDMKAGELIAYAESKGLDLGGLVPQSGREKILSAVRTALGTQG